MRARTALAAIAGLALGGGFLVGTRAEPPHHELPASKDGTLVVGLCDGKTTAEIPGVREGETPSRAQAQAVSDRLMEEWRRKNPGVRWDEEPLELAQTAPAPGASTPPRQGAAEGAPEAAERQGGAATPGQAAAQGATAGGAGGMPSAPQGAVQEGHTYGAFTARDEAIWKAETERFVAEGDRIFHSAERLGGTIAVSCDMCHPNAANTHPETYPKYQVQFGRVALLRDMINWCIENPVRGRPLPDDDPRLKALEAYILAQRKGTPLDYGKH